jgi:hypothetical protein
MSDRRLQTVEQRKGNGDYTSGGSVEKRKQGCSNTYTYKYIHTNCDGTLKKNPRNA